MKDVVFKTIMLKGEAGGTISTIEKTSTSGVVDTYTITLNDGTTQTFEVTNGSDIDTIEKTGTTGAVDTYTVTLTNGDTTTFEVTNGESYEVPTNGVILFDGSTAPEGYEIISNPLSGATTSLKFAKKVSDTNVKGFGEIIDSFNTGDNKATNAPSLNAVIKRTDNNLLANADLTSLTHDGDDSFANGLGWAYSASGLSITNSGLKISNSIQANTKFYSPRWYGKNIDDLTSVGFDYVTLTMAYRGTASNPWNWVSYTFNCETKTPASADIFTYKGTTVSANVFYNGRIEFIASQAPSSGDIYIGYVKLEKGSSSTGYTYNVRDKVLLQDSYTFADEVNTALSAEISDINTSIEDLFYKDDETARFVYQGGCFLSSYSSTDMTFSFIVPIRKFDTNIDTSECTVTINNLKYGTSGNLTSSVTSATLQKLSGVLTLTLQVDSNLANKENFGYCYCDFTIVFGT